MGMRERIQSVIDNTPDVSVRSVSLAAGMSDSMLHKFLRGQTDSMTIKTADGEVKIDTQGMQDFAKRMEAMAAEQEKANKKLQPEPGASAAQ